MKARVVYDADGTAELDLEADRISVQLWRGGRCLIRLVDAGKVVREIHLSRVWSVDKDRR